MCPLFLRTALTIGHVAVAVPSPLVSSLSTPSSDLLSRRDKARDAAALASLIQDIVLCHSKSERQAIVFVSTKHAADAIGNASGLDGISVAALHGGIAQETRDKVMEGFRKGLFPRHIYTTYVCIKR